MVTPATQLSEITNWDGGPRAVWVPHPVGCACADCERGLRGKPVLAQPALSRLIGDQIAPTKAATQPATTIRAENKRVRRERMKRLVLALHGRRTRNCKTT